MKECISFPGMLVGTMIRFGCPNNLFVLESSSDLRKRHETIIILDLCLISWELITASCFAHLGQESWYSITPPAASWRHWRQNSRPHFSCGISSLSVFSSRQIQHSPLRKRYTCDKEAHVLWPARVFGVLVLGRPKKMNE